MRISVPPQVCSTSSGCAAMARISTGFSIPAEGELTGWNILVAGVSVLLPRGRHDGDQKNSREKSADVREPGDVAARSLRVTNRSDAVKELNGEPIKQQE